MHLRPLLLLLALTTVSAVQAQTLNSALDSPLDHNTARSLLGRFGYGPTPDSIRLTAGLTPRQYLRRAIDKPSSYPISINNDIAALSASEPLSDIWSIYGFGASKDLKNTEESRNEFTKAANRYFNEATQIRLLESANSDNQGHEVLLNFWLNHFSVHGQKGHNRFLALDYARNLEKAMAEDSFLALLRASFFHPAMQIYLDNNQSVAPNSTHGKSAAAKGKSIGLNENLARELLELHTLGVDGGYSQQDIIALARIISGAGVYNVQHPQVVSAPGALRLGAFHFNPARHDFSEKQLLGQAFPAGQGLAEIDEALRQLASHPATANHIAGKLARRFLADEPPADVLNAMTVAFLRSGGKISETLYPLLDSPAFAESLRRPGKFKEPIDYLLSAARAACAGQPIGNAQYLLAAANDLAQAPFMRTTPDGYGSQQKDWLSAAAMAKRIRLARNIGEVRVALAAAPTPTSKAISCRPQPEILQQLMPPLSDSSRAALAGLSLNEEITVLLASPEFMHR